MSHKLTILPFLIKFTPKFPQSIDHDEHGLNVYAFDLDHTIIKPKSPNISFSRSASDWQFISFNSKKSTLDYLCNIIDNDPTAVIVIFSNQGGVITVPRTSKSCTKYTNKILLFLKAIKNDERGETLSHRLWLYAAPKRPKTFAANHSKITFASLGESYNNDPNIFGKVRKPMTGMVEFFKRDLESAYRVSEQISPIKLNWIYYCGDAAGRKKDFSDSDIKFAENLHVEFKYPEEIFHG
ncbi:Tpp1p [Saccharomyces cerevisiae YJM195]|nr:Tpp1p [Saccharomyces cerevisiae YJM195]